MGLTDSLTLLYGRRYMHETAAAEAERSAVQLRPFSVVLFELTGVPERNRRHGYAAGDTLIQDANRIVQRAASRAGAIACRCGGARLGLVVPGADSAAAEALALAVRVDLEAQGAEAMTGVACWQEGDSGEDVVARARLGLAVRGRCPGRLVPPGPSDGP